MKTIDKELAEYYRINRIAQRFNKKSKLILITVYERIKRKNK